MSSLKVPVGVTSVAGYTVTLAGAVGAVLAFLKGDRSDQTLGVLASAGVAALAFLSTQLGRYAQAHAIARKVPPRAATGVLSGTTASEYVRDTIQKATADRSEELGYEKGMGVAGSWDDDQSSELAAADAFEEDAGDDPPPEADLYPLTDPRGIDPDEGDGEAEGSA